VGVKIILMVLLSLMNPPMISGMPSELMMLCRMKTDQTNLLDNRISPNRIEARVKSNKPMIRKRGMLVAIDPFNML
jgi:hypothetical protein